MHENHMLQVVCLQAGSHTRAVTMKADRKISCPSLSVCFGSTQVVIRYDSGQGPVTALAITPEDCFLAGTASGALVS